MAFKRIHKPTREQLKCFMRDKTNKEAARYFGISVRTISRLIQDFGLNYEEMKYGYLPSLNEEQQELIIASLLGDAGLEKTGRFKLGQTMVGNKIEYVEWMQQKLQPYTSDVRKDGPSFRFYTITHSIFKNLRDKWYPAGKKIVPRDISLNANVLAHWHIQDGTNNQGKRSIRLATDCFSKDDVNFLRSKLLKQLGIKSTLQMKHGIYPKIHIGAYEYLKVIDIISPHVTWDCFKYKIDTSKVKVKKNENLGGGKLNKKAAKDIRQLYFNDDVRVSDIAKKYGVGTQSVYNVLNNITYPEIETARISVTYNPKET